MPSREPLSREARKLIDLVYRYYPRWNPAEETLAEFEQRQYTTSEYQARKEVGLAAMARLDVWHAWRRSLKRALPGYFVVDCTNGVDPSYCISLVRETFRQHPGEPVLLVTLSFLAPYYHIEEIGDPEGPGNAMVTDRISAHLVPVVEVVEQSLAQHFEARRIDPTLLRFALPDIITPRGEPGEAELEDALFSDG